MVDIRSAIVPLCERNADHRVSVAVVGDVMVDEYYRVTSSRVSAEFPVPILLSATAAPDPALPGGAANVCRQLLHFNADVRLYGLVDDYARSVLRAYGIDASGCVDLPGGATVPVKRRVYDGTYPVCRWDVERGDYGIVDPDAHRKVQKSLLANYASDPAPDVVIFSDYAKGCFAGSGGWFRDGVLSVVDPKCEPVRQWRGCTVFKPNAKEASHLSGGVKGWRQQAKFFRDELECRSVVITQGGDGVAGLAGDEEFEYRPSETQAAESVIGAGDCFAAVLAVGLAHGMGEREAAAVAWEAGSVYVRNRHNRPVTPSELLARADPAGAKMVADPASLRERDFRLVMTNGCFDAGLTRGHVESLRYAKRQGGRLLVAVNSDASARRLKGEGRPVLCQADRANIIASLDCVDYVCVFDADTPIGVIEAARPDVLVKGGDYRPEDVVGRDLAEVRISPLYGCESTSGKVSRMRDK